MSHGSYDLNLGSKRLILARDIRPRSWPNIGDSYGISFVRVCLFMAKSFVILLFLLCCLAVQDLHYANVRGTTLGMSSIAGLT
jgi:hypothetical protein